MRGALLVSIVLLLGATGHTFSVTKGLGPPDTRGWCPADWLVACTTGTAALGPEGLFLSNPLVPPRSAYELELKLLPYRALLFSLEGKQAVGHVVIYLDGVLLERVAVEEGPWWIKLEGLPEEGLLRLELDDHCESILLRSVYFPCRWEPGPIPECRDRFWEGILLGAGLTVALLVGIYILVGVGD